MAKTEDYSSEIETQKYYSYFDKYSYNFTSLENLEFKELNIVNDSELLVEVTNKSNKIALIEEIFVVVKDKD